MVDRVDSNIFNIANSCYGPPLSGRLRPLPEEDRRVLFILNACLEKAGGLHGRLCHQIFGDWLASGFKTESELQEWLILKFGPASAVCRCFHKAAEQADLWCGEDFKVVVCNSGMPHDDNIAPSCPQVLFGKGSFRFGKKRAAVFNSRKLRIVSPEENWLVLLRAALHLLKSSHAGILGSFGTITYDLVTAYSLGHGLDLLLVVPSHIESSHQFLGERFLNSDATGCTVLSCLTRAVK